MEGEEVIHASCVKVGDRAVLILGASGAGKSTLALALMAVGGMLVADDRTLIRRAGGLLLADCPAEIRGRIEARGIGILRAEAAGVTPVGLVVDLDRREDRRLPPPRHVVLAGVALPVVLGPLHPGLAAGVRQFALYGLAGHDPLEDRKEAMVLDDPREQRR